MTKKQVAFCGYRCDLCPAYEKNLDKYIERTALRKGWRTFFGFDVPEERITCVGCHDQGNHLDTNCTVRPCAMEKGFSTCASCDCVDSCEKLHSRADIIDETKKRFAGKISQKDYELFFRPYEGRSELRKQKKN